MTDLPPCKWCGETSASFIKARKHRQQCPRLLALGFDLEARVRDGKLTLAAAEAEQAKRPELRL